MKQQHKAWAIEVVDGEVSRLLGKYWWFQGRAPLIPAHMEGYKTAVFETRREAREGLQYALNYPKARVVRVLVTVEVV